MEKTFQITIFKNRLFSIGYAISQLGLNIRIIETKDLPGPLPSDQPDMVVTCWLLPGADLSEIYYLGDRASKEPTQLRTF